MALKAKPQINIHVQSLVKERNIRFKQYSKENNPHLNIAKHNEFKRIQNLASCKIKIPKCNIMKTFS